MEKEYEIRGEESVNYVKMRQLIDNDVREVVTELINKEAQDRILAKIKGAGYPRCMREVFIPHILQSLLNGMENGFSTFMMADANKLYSDYSKILEDLKANEKNIKDVLVFFMPEEDKYIYFESKEKCEKFLGYYNGPFLIEIIADDAKQNFSLVVPLKPDKDKTFIGDIFNKLMVALSKFTDKPMIYICETNDTIWFHVTNIYFDNFREVIANLGKILTPWGGMLRHPNLGVRPGVSFGTWDRIIPNSKLVFNGKETVKEKLENKEKIQIFHNYINNTYNNITLTGNNSVIAVNSPNVTNNQAINVEAIVDQNPPKEGELSTDYKTRINGIGKMNVTAQNLANILTGKGYSQIRNKTKRAWSKKK